ncbi:MAG: proline dehydrogenase [Saprospiraceae bacterium]|nr:proline dehydrogenase [Saprospiraceae bacterium]
MDEDLNQPLDFQNTQIAFSHRNDKNLKQLHSLFKAMNSPKLVKIGSAIAPTAIKLNLPFVKSIINKTIFNQFVGGYNLLDTQGNIDDLYRSNTMTILDFGAESKTTEEELDRVMRENIKSVELAASNSCVPAISTKLTGLAPNELLEKMQTDVPLTESEQREKAKFENRIDSICKRAYELGAGVMIDAEESWMQITMDRVVDDLMKEYNKEKVIVYNTYQLYRIDKLDFLKESFEKAESDGYQLGAKLVRGAYMNKEREYANENGLKDLIHKTRESTDKDFNAAIKFCVDNYKTMASVCASHNETSNLYQAKLIDERGIEKTHPHLNFSQLFGMSDNITFNLARAGYNVAKYMPYGPLKEVIPYLIRRANENTSVTGDMSRELALIAKEIKRRGL